MLYQRNARVTIWRTEKDKFFSQPEAFNATIINKLRLQFQVARTQEKDPNTCEVTITNASPETRAFVERKPLALRLEAGYAGNYHQLFVGDIRWAVSKQEGVEWLTTIQIADGDKAYRFGRVSESFRAGSTVLDALKKCAVNLQLVLPENVLEDPNLHTQFATGQTLNGSVATILTKILEPYGYVWSIQAGRFVILRESETTGIVYVVNANNGMVGSPETATPEKPGKPPVTAVRTLLDHRIVPGSRVQLDTSHIQGTFKVTKSSHDGDPHGGDFATTFECVAL